MESGEKEAEPMNGTRKEKLPGYINEFNWQKLHPEANPGDTCRFEVMLAHISEIYPLN